jgi:manganese transport protein
LIVAAATFNSRGRHDVAEIQDAYRLLSPTLGLPIAGGIFAIALLCSGQNSTLTGTLAGQIVMEGFLNIRIRPWLRRLITRGIAIVPAVIVASLYGASGTAKLLLLSQVILSLQLSFGDSTRRVHERTRKDGQVRFSRMAQNARLDHRRVDRFIESQILV